MKIRIIQIRRTHIILPNSYMLGSSTSGKKRRCGLKPQRQQMNTKPSFSRYVSFPQKLEALKVSYKKLPSLTSLVIKHFLFWGRGETCGTLSENIRLIISTLQAQELFSSKLSYNFPCFFAVTGEIVVTLHSSNRRTCASLWADTHF